MAREIADSDDESDIDIAQLGGAGNGKLLSHLDASPDEGRRDHIAEVNAESAQPPTDAASTDNFDFDQFVSLDSSVDRIRIAMQDESLKQTVGGGGAARSGSELSTTHALQGSVDLGVTGATAMTEKTGSRNRAKRRQETQDLIEQMGPPMREDTPRDNKRRKTYGSTSKHQLHDIDYLMDSAAAISDNGEETVSPEFGQSIRTSKTPDSISLGLANSNSLGARRNISTSNSSMGGYQSINIDLRGTNGSLDFDANPFGTVSQVSVGDDLDAARIRNFFPAQRDVLHLPLANEHLTGVDPAVLMHNRSPSYPNDTQPVSSRPLQKPESLGKTPSTISPPTVKTDASQESLFPDQPDAPAPKKKAGRKKSKSEKSLSSSIYAEGHEPGGSTELAFGVQDEYLHHLTTTAKDAAPKLIDYQVISTSTKREVQGLSKRKRSCREDEAEVNMSPTKEPSSELHLSDELVIGLPREQYKPRPSRSRSKRIADEEDDNQVVSITAKSEVAVEESTESMAPPIIEKTPAATKQKGGKKTKVKRAKTTIHRAPEPMVDDGDDDVVWMDAKPLSVDIGQLQQISPSKALELKQEDAKAGSKHRVLNRKKDIETMDEVQKDDAASIHSAVDEHHDNNTEEDVITVTSKRRGRPPKIMIEIPAMNPSQSPPPAAAPDIDEAHTSTTSTDLPTQPKKRGRKSKKTTKSDEIAEPVSDAKDDSAPAVGTKHSSILRDKDTNLPLHPPSETPSLRRRRPQSDHESENEDPPLTHAPSPTKPKSPHSPIKDILKLSQTSPTATSTTSGSVSATTILTTTTTTSSLQGGLSRYRVGLSRRTAIPSLLRIVRKEPKVASVAVKKGGRKKGAASGGAEAAVDAGGDVGAESGVGGADAGRDGNGDGDADGEGEERPQGLNELLRAGGGVLQLVIGHRAWLIDTGSVRENVWEYWYAKQGGCETWRIVITDHATCVCSRVSSILS